MSLALASLLGLAAATCVLASVGNGCPQRRRRSGEESGEGQGEDHAAGAVQLIHEVVSLVHNDWDVSQLIVRTNEVVTECLC